MILNRTRVLIDRPVRQDAEFVLYWMTSARRTRSNFALERAVDLAREHRKPLVVLEALRAGYEWANDRLHHFAIDGMAENARRFAGTPVCYLPFVERTPGGGKGLLRALSQHAAAVITDDYPAFFLPRMLDAAVKQVDARFEAVDTNGIVPMRAAARCFSTAHSFRAYLQSSLRGHIQAGYLWTLGRYDRPWFPERPVFGTIRYMTSGSTMKKLRMKPYLAKYGPG